MSIATDTVTGEAPPRRHRRGPPRSREAFRNELIAIARDIFQREGYAGVTIRRITAAAGLTAMSFYSYFENKEALLTVIWDDLIQDSVRVCQDAVPDQAPPVDQVVAYFDTFLGYWLARGDDFRFIFLSDSNQVDYIGLRKRLFTLRGVSSHFENYMDLARPLFAGRPDVEPSVDALRLQSMFMALGFLHCAIGVYSYTPDELRPLRALLGDDLRRRVRDLQGRP